MEAVRAFNNELSSLYEGRPPISRAKMAQVTKCAIKAIKFYKHVVQSVEKFIQKCKPEYKVPGLYVIDSIVRQSRHQFGPEKDVFSPRFTKNIVPTFTNLLKCPPEERSRIVRVLNLWQKNSVFPVDVIQPLLDLAADPNNAELVAAAHRSVDAVVSVTQKVPLPGTHSSSNGNTGDSSSNQLLQQKDMLTTITKLLQQAQDGSISATAPESQLQQLQHLQQQLVMQTERISKPQQSAPPIDSNLLAQIQTLTNQLLTKTGGAQEAVGAGDAGVRPVKSAEPGFNKKLLDFDYGESDDDDDHQQQDMHHHQQQQQQHHHQQQQHHHQQQQPPPPMHLNPMLNQGGIPALLQNANLLPPMPPMPPHPQEQEQMRQRFLEQQQQEFDREIGQSAMMNQEAPQEVVSNQGQDDNEDDRDRDRDRRRHRSRERSRSPRRRRRSRSRSRDRRRRSRSRDRYRRSRSRDRGGNARRDREKERERKKAGLPSLKDNCISVCTTTLWFGHLTKHTTEEELRGHIERYGTIKTINMIPPRGCAFVCLTKRKDAFKALDRLKGVKVNGNALKVAWAPGIGVKESMFKDLWDVDQGVTYVPWDQLPMDIGGLLGGGMVDDDSLPSHLKGIKNGEEEESEQPQSGSGNQMMSTNEDSAKQQPQQQQQPQQKQQQMMMGMQGQSNFPGMNMSGNMSSNMSGNMSTNMSGNMSSNMSGNMSSNMSGNMSSNMSGNMSSNLSGNMSSNLSGNMPGQGPMGMVGPRGPLGMLAGAPPSLGMRPVAPLGGHMNLNMNMNAGGPTSNMNLNMNMNAGGPPSNMGGLSTMGGGNGPRGGPAGLGHSPGLRPTMDMNMQSQSPMSGGMIDRSPSTGAMMGGQSRMDASMMGGQSRMDGSMMGQSRMDGSMMGQSRMDGSMMGQSRMDGSMMGQSRMDGSMMGGRSRMDGPRLPMGMGNLGNRPPFPMPPFSQMQGRGGNRLSFFNNLNNLDSMNKMNNMVNNNDSQDSGLDSDMRGASETKEWPPDDEVNAEDEDHDSDPMDSDERMMPPMQHQQHNMPGLRALGPGGPFRPRGPMMHGMQTPNSILANMSRAQNPSTAISSMLSLRMMQSSQQRPVLAMPGGAGPSAAAFNLAQNLARAGIRIPLPGLNLPRPGIVPTTASQRMLPPSPGTGLAVSVGLNNSSVVVPAINISSGPSPHRSPTPDMPPPSSLPSDRSDSPQTSRSGSSDGPVPLMQVQGSNSQPSGGAILGRGFSPMTIRPRGGAGLLGIRPGAQQTGGFNRFSGPRPLLGPSFGNFERPSFGGRVGGSVRPKLPGFFDEDKDERRLQKLDVDERSGHGDFDERGRPKDVDERRISPVDERPKNNDQEANSGASREGILSSGRKSRWSDAVATESSNVEKFAPVVADTETESNMEEMPKVESPSMSEKDEPTVGDDIGDHNGIVIEQKDKVPEADNLVEEPTCVDEQQNAVNLEQDQQEQATPPSESVEVNNEGSVEAVEDNEKSNDIPTEDS